jgi:hypothetical protein
MPEGAHRAELLVEMAVQLVVGLVPVELALRSLDEAVDGHGHHQDDLLIGGSLRRGRGGSAAEAQPSAR